MVKMIAHLVDGGLWESDFAEDILREAARLRQEGLGDRAIIHKIITDDWGAKPIYVELVSADTRLRLVY